MAINLPPTETVLLSPSGSSLTLQALWNSAISPSPVKLTLSLVVLFYRRGLGGATNVPRHLRNRTPLRPLRPGARRGPARRLERRAGPGAQRGGPLLQRPRPRLRPHRRGAAP